MAAEAALCGELDAAALELLEALETLQRRRDAFAACLEQGWLSLSQARYALGCHRVSALQYGATMVPRVRVAARAAAAARGPPGPPPGPGAPPRPPDLVRDPGAPEPAAGAGQLLPGRVAGGGAGRAAGSRDGGRRPLPGPAAPASRRHGGPGAHGLGVTPHTDSA
ncbi:coiled-coil domain-containing protein 115 isoform X3 [Struthio camelus]|uniref:coiled-coil domain-containing protein 115 isoform X3 n=1 Tax=Struthio camelus TaxID=8801 RepID=UPI003603CABE